MRYRLQRHDGTDCSATMVPITVLRMVPIQRYRHNHCHVFRSLNVSESITRSFWNPRKVPWLQGKKPNTDGWTTWCSLWPPPVWNSVICFISARPTSSSRISVPWRLHWENNPGWKDMTKVKATTRNPPTSTIGWAEKKAFGWHVTMLYLSHWRKPNQRAYLKWTNSLRFSKSDPTKMLWWRI